MGKKLIKLALHEIKGSLGRFLALIAIVALGVGIFSGLRISRDRMVATADQYVDDLSLYDYRLLSTLGFTEEDVAAFQSLPFVEHAVGAHYEDVVVVEDDTEEVVRIHSLTDEVNTPLLTAGRMPETSSECLADSFFYKEDSIGTTISLSGEEENLKDHELTIVGLVQSPMYLSHERGTTSVGTGRINAFLYVLPEAFDVDYYTEIYLTLTQHAPIYTDAYDQEIEETQDQVESLLDERAQIRYEDLKSEAEDKLTDAKQEVADGELELADGKTELEDAQKEVDDGWIELAENEQKLNDAQQEVDDGWKELADGKTKLEDAQKEVDDGWVELVNAKQELEDAQKEVDDGLAELESGRAELEENQRKYDSNLRQLDQNRDQLLESKQSLDEGRQTLEASAQQLQSAKAAAMEQAAQQTIAAGGQAVPGDPIYDAAVAQVEAAFAANEAEIESKRAELEASQAQWEYGWNQLQDGYQQLRQAEKELADAWNTFRDGEQELKDAQQEIDDGWAEVAENEQKLKDSQQDISDGWLELAENEQKLKDSQKEIDDGWPELKDARQELLDAQQEIDDGWIELQDGEQELQDAYQEISDGETELADLEEPDTYTLTRDENIGYASYENDTNIVKAIAVVFPVFFFLVAALVCVTTMTRMVDEQRTQIGIFKSLGYSENSILTKYFFYAGVAAVIGSVGGYFLGISLIPLVIWKAYNMIYGFSEALAYVVDPWLFLISLVGYLLCTVGTTWLCCRSALQEVPASLIRPKPPKNGKRILLERVTPLWRRLNFFHKVCLRNLMRYKQRFFMMVLGIGGCTALLLTGFGIKDSIQDVVHFQYDEIMKYDADVVFSDPLSQEQQDSFLSQHSDVLGDALFSSVSSVDVDTKNGTKSVSLVSPAGDSLEGFMDLHRGNTQVSFPEDGEVVINLALANRQKIEVGDTLTIRDSDMNTATLTVSGIFDNYVSNYAIVNNATLEAFSGEIQYNTAYIYFAEGSDAHEAAARLMEDNSVGSVTINRDTAERVENTMQSLDYIVALVILCAGALAFVVLYNLTTINITERNREIATVKVLGFFQRETSAYIFRENDLLTVIGGVIGLGLGRLLHFYVMSQIKIDAMYFDVRVDWQSYLYSLALTILFALIVKVAMQPRIAHINMAESLKSVE